MIHRNCTQLALAVVWAATVVSSALWAQEVKTESAAKLPVVEMSQPEDSAVEAILGTNPSTPREWVYAAKVLADLRRFDLAKSFLQKILEAKLDQKQLAGLEQEFGSAVFVSMASRAELRPEGSQVGQAVLAATQRELTDPQRLAGWVADLGAPSDAVRSRAIEGLMLARGAAVGPLMAVLADPGRAAEHAGARAMLVRLGRDAVGPLVAALEAQDPKLVVEAIKTLVDLNARDAVVWLVGPSASPQTDPAVRAAATGALAKWVGHVPATGEAARLLAGRAREYFQGRQPLKSDEQGLVAIWSWDAAAKSPAVKRYPADAAVRLEAARLATNAFRVDPQDPQIQLLYLATMLEKAAYEHGLDHALPGGPGTPAAVAAGFDRGVLEALLVDTMHSGHTPAAAAAARILGTKGTAEELLCQGPQPAPLVQATRSPDWRLRFAAVETIVKLRPSRPFAGSNYVTEALEFFIGTSGSPRALVVMPVREEARQIGGLLSGLGFQVETAVTAGETMRQLFASPDYEIALIATSMGESTIETLVQQLRLDHRTAWLPIGILARLEQTKLAEHVAGGDRLTVAFVRPHTVEDARWLVERLALRLGPLRVPFAQRQKTAAAALGWAVALSDQRPSLFDVRRLEDAVLRAQQVPALARQASAVLGNLGTPKSQEWLVAQASQGELPLPTRKAALSAFRQSVERFGVLLTSQQILRQYDRYNQTAGMDRPTQHLLGLILDCIEARAKASEPEGPNGAHAPRPATDEPAERDRPADP